MVSHGTLTWEKQPDSEIFETGNVDFDFIKTLGLQLVEGRSFSAQIPSDRRAIVVNESFIKEREIKNPIGREIQLIDEKKIKLVAKKIV